MSEPSNELSQAEAAAKRVLAAAPRTTGEDPFATSFPRAEELSAALNGLLAGIDQDVARFRSNLEAEALKTVSDEESAAEVRRVMGPRWDKAARQRRDELAAGKDPLRKEIVAQLDAVAQRAELQSVMAKSPSAFLEARASADPRFPLLVQELRGAGPAVLVNRLAQARLSGDVVAVGALCRVCAEMPREQRPFSPGDAATTVVGPAQKEFAAVVGKTLYAASHGRLASDTLVTGRRPNAVDRIRSGLNAPRPVVAPEDFAPDSTPIGKIQRGLRAREEGRS